MKVIDDLRESKGYQYVDLIFNLNDLTILCVMIIFLLSFGLLYLFKPEMYESIFAYILLIIFILPCLVHFLSKLVKGLYMKNKIKKYRKNGKMYYADIISETKYKSLFNPNLLGDNSIIELSEIEERFSYLPTISFEKDGRRIEMTSKYPMSNSYREVLGSPKIIIYLYKEDFVITDTREAFDSSSSINQLNRRVDTMGENEHAWQVKRLTMLAFIILVFTYLTRIGLKIVLQALMK